MLTHPQATPTKFSCSNCGTVHNIPAVMDASEMSLDRCGVCLMGGGPVQHEGSRIDAFRRRQARAKRNVR